MDKAVVASVILGISGSVLLGLLILQVFSATRRPVLLRSVAIVVLGDVGRSPRMMYHAESFASNGFTTYIIGNKGTRPIPSLLSLPRVRFCYLPDPPRAIPGTPFILSAPRKVASQIFSILEALLVRVPNPPEFIIVQNPPSIPTLALVWLVGWLRGSKVIIDWHNLGYSILALKLGERHPLVRIAEWFEGFFGRSAYAHLFVTRAMRDQLISKWSLRGKKIVLHDRPPAHFHRASESEMHELFLRLLSPSNSPSNPAFSNLSSPILNNWLPSYDPPQSTPFTHILPHRSLTSSESQPYLAQRTDRPALVVSSTSWTPDEDFGVLLAALSAYDKKAKISEGRLPKVLMIVTGKGPDRAKWLKEVDALQGNKADEKDRWTHVRLLSMWLEAADYPLLLGSADLGISLHSSSSGIDLPMKVVDMFGCGLPVCALNFACLDELVKDGVNGLVFNNADQLAAQLESLLTNFPSSPALSSLRTSLELDKHTDAGMHSPRSPQYEEPSSLVEPQEHGEEGKEGEWEWCTWAQNWDRVMKPVLLSDLSVDRE